MQTISAQRETAASSLWPECIKLDAHANTPGHMQSFRFIAMVKFSKKAIINMMTLQVLAVPESAFQTVFIAMEEFTIEATVTHPAYKEKWISNAND